MSVSRFDPGAANSRSTLGADAVDRLYAPTSDGSTLPNIAYLDEAFLRVEQERIFRRTWVFAGFLHDLPRPGDVVPVELAGRPLFLARGAAGQVRAFHNVCSHRGAKLIADRKCGLRTIVCPNHSWTYELDGRLRAHPHFFGGEKHDLNGSSCHRADLREVRCDTWLGWVFVNLDGSAATLVEHLAAIDRRLGGRDLGAIRVGATLEFEIEANWKLPVENFIEPSHVFSCHPWLNSFVGMAEREAPTFDGHVLSCGYEFKQSDPARGQGLPYFPINTIAQLPAWWQRNVLDRG